MDDSTRQDLRSGCCKMLKASYKNAVGGKQPHEGAVFLGSSWGGVTAGGDNMLSPHM